MQCSTSALLLFLKFLVRQVSTSAKQSFSNYEIFKYNMTQDCSSALELLSIEEETARKVYFDEIVVVFGDTKA